MQILVGILCNNSNNVHVIYFGIKLYLIRTNNAVENGDVIIGYYSSQTVKILLTGECEKQKFSFLLPLQKDI
jgi:hypothetical protein